MQGILQILRQVSAILDPEFEQDIEDGLSNLHKSLVKAYRRGVALKIFTSNNVQPVGTNVAYWAGTAMKEFLGDYDVWEKTIKIRLQILRMSKEAEEVLTKEIMASIPQLGISSETTFTCPPIDTDQLVGLQCSWAYSQEGSAVTIVEFRYYHDAVAHDLDEFSKVEQDVLDTVRVLKGGDDRVMNIPKCIGYYHDIGHQRFVLIHAIPRDHGHPRSLRDLLTHPNGLRSKKSLVEFAYALGQFRRNDANFVDQVLAHARSDRRTRHSLDHRLRVATQLAQSVLYVHSAQLVHKHISPENILLLTRAGADKYGSFPYALGDPFLIGFDRTRSEKTVSTGKGELDIADCLYHHPERWGRISGMRFSMLHDIYSLGIVLLEIALWDSMIVWLPKEFGLSERYIAWKFIRCMFDEREGCLKQKYTAVDVQTELISFAKRYVPSIMGEGYTNVVVSCLSGDFKAADVDNFKDGGIGFRYMIHVISKLERLQLR
jgi:hypothetical protein